MSTHLKRASTSYWSTWHARASVSRASRAAIPSCLQLPRIAELGGRAQIASPALLIVGAVAALAALAAVEMAATAAGATAIAAEAPG